MGLGLIREIIQATPTNEIGVKSFDTVKSLEIVKSSNTFRQV